MERAELTSKMLYQQGDTGLCLLTAQELSGRYPSWLSHEAVNQHNSHWRRPATLIQVNQFVDSLTADKSKLVFAVYAMKDNVHIGNVSLQSIDQFNQCAEMAFLFGETQYWGKGYAAQSARLVMGHAFKHMNINRLYLGCLKKNTPMNKLAIKLGFIQEGLRRQALFNDGIFQDVVEYGLLKDEFTDRINR
mgnify:FL=1